MYLGDKMLLEKLTTVWKEKFVSKAIFPECQIQSPMPANEPSMSLILVNLGIV